MRVSDRSALWKDLLAAVRPEARRAGFRSAGVVFYRLQDEGRIVASFSYQRDPRDTEYGIKFCVNLDLIAVRLLSPSEQGAAPAVLVRRVDGHWQTRLVPENGLDDYWWLLNNDSREEVLAWHKGSIASRVHPQLQLMGSEASLFSLWRSGASPGLTKKLANEYLGALSKLIE